MSSIQIFVPKESPAERRVALIPDAVAKLTARGYVVTIETGAGLASDFDDPAYAAAGASISSDRSNALAQADIVLRIHPPAVEEIPLQKAGSWHLSFLDPFAEQERLEAFRAAKITAVSLQFIPRTTLAQKMDALSSQANLAGYEAVVLAASRLNKILPMMMTPAGTISPARVFVVGVGVAGLQAIATAKRLGARVEAFDTRPVVEEQVKSLGAKFIKIDLGETGQTEQGYAKALTPEQIKLQQDGMAKVCAYSDIVVTTAKLFGRKAPILLTAGMVAGMRRGSVIVDLATEGGGNVEGSRRDEEVLTDQGVLIIGHGALEARVARDASQMFAANLVNFIEHFRDKESGALPLQLEDEILQGCVLTHAGEIVHPTFKPGASA